LKPDPPGTRIQIQQSIEGAMVIDDDDEETGESGKVGVSEDDSDLVVESEANPGPRSFLAGLILGTVLGLSVALLFAPDAGEDTRRKLGKRVRRLQKRAEEETSELARRAKKRLARAKW
jgi:hypothetical protein